MPDEFGAREHAPLNVEEALDWLRASRPSPGNPALNRLLAHRNVVRAWGEELPASGDLIGTLMILQVEKQTCGDPEAVSPSCLWRIRVPAPVGRS